MASHNDPDTLLTSLNDFDSLVLEEFQLGKRKIHFRELVGDGSAGYVFRVRIADKEYALKIFKSDRPDLNPTFQQGARRRAYYDPFYIECRANGSIIAEGWNGLFSPFCHGWLNIPLEVERYMYRKFRLHPFLWDKPDDDPDQELRAILFDYIDGKKLYETPLNSHIVNQARNILEKLQEIDICHNDVAVLNFLVQSGPEEEKLFILDFSNSFTLPHVYLPERRWKSCQQSDFAQLEIGFKLLSELPINENLHDLADMAVLESYTADQLSTACDNRRVRWHPYEHQLWYCCGRCPNSKTRLSI